jgi:hypothetical protein
VLEEEEDRVSLSGGGDKLTIVDGLVQLQVDNSLGHLFVPHPLRIFNQE